MLCAFLEWWLLLTWSQSLSVLCVVYSFSAIKDHFWAQIHIAVICCLRWTECFSCLNRIRAHQIIIRAVGRSREEMSLWRIASLLDASLYGRILSAWLGESLILIEWAVFQWMLGSKRQITLSASVNLWRGHSLTCMCAFLAQKPSLHSLRNNGFFYSF